MYSKDILQKVREATDAEALVSRYVPLKEKGGRLWGCCPFHQEKTPSFALTPDKQVWYCHGCHEGGDLFDFISRIEGVSFLEAVRLLAEVAGIDLPDDQVDTEQRRHLYVAVETAMKFYISKRKTSEQANEYLISRGIPEDIADEFKIGFAGPGLLEYLKKCGINEQDAEQAGIIAYKDGRAYDRFYSRITFPILNQKGRPIAFGARTIKEDAKYVKYINSPETPLFKKGDTLFGISSGAPAMKAMGFALMVEGYLDVIACCCAGFPNTVAPMGTTLTPSQVRAVLRRTKQVVVFFDGDNAGLAASKKSAEAFLNTDAEVRVAVLPPKEDPHSLFITKGFDGIADVVRSSHPLYDFVLSEAVKTIPVQGKVKATNSIALLLSRVENAIERALLTEKAAAVLDVPLSAMEEEIKKKVHPVVIKGKAISGGVEDEFIGLIGMTEGFIDEARELVPPETLSSPECRQIVASAYSLQAPNAVQILDTIESKEARNRFAQACIASETIDKDACLRKMSLATVENKIREASRNVEALATQGTTLDVLEKIAALQAQRRILLNSSGNPKNKEALCS